MATNQKLYLFQLIQSLSSSEKGYVKKYCKRNGTGVTYLKLFDAIDKQEVYDEDAIKKKFRKEKFVKQFSVAKNYLIKSILKSLRAYYSESSNNIKVHELLLEIEILFKKRLVGLCQKLIKKAKQLVIESELFNHYEELAFWDFRLTLLTEYTEETDQHMNDLQAFGQEGLESNLLLNQYRHLAYEVYKYSFKEGYSREEEALLVAEKFGKHPLLTQQPSSKNAKALGRYFNIWTKIHELHNDFEKAYEASQGFVAVIQQNPAVFSDFIMSTIIPAHYNLLASCIQMNKEEVFFENLAYLKNIPKTYKNKGKSIQQITHFYTVSLELQFYTQNAHFEKAKAILPAAKKIIEEENLLEIGLAMLHVEMTYSIAYAYFGLGDYDESENWVNLTLEHQKNNLREDVLCLAHLLHLTNHAELGNYQYLSYKIRSTYNFIKKMQKAHTFEKVILKFLKKLINIRNSTELRSLLDDYKEKFAEIEKDPLVYMIIKNFDVISLLESKLTDKRFATIAAQRRKQGMPSQQ